VLTSGEHTKPAGRRVAGAGAHPRPGEGLPPARHPPGGQDGLVNILGILGVLAGGGGRTILLSTGLAAAITESISMGAVGYTSTIADRDY
jgi:VIT family